MGLGATVTTAIKTGRKIFDDFYPTIRGFMAQDVSEFMLDGRLVRGYRSPDSKPVWLRDHVYQMKGYRYFESDVKSALEHFAETQAGNGRLFDYFVVGEDRENWAKYVRVPVEADVEFLFVLGVHGAWQASGDDDWLRRMLPHCERALHYTMTHPWRWSEAHQLVKRAFTIDMWDFDFVEGSEWLNFQISDRTHFCIFHGDNSGLYAAVQAMANVHDYLGEGDKAVPWRDVAAGIRERANDLCWNGRFYTHQVHLDDFRVDGVDEDQQLSLSNPHAINRGLATHEMAVELIREYQRRRESSDAFAEWHSIDPPFPSGMFGTDELPAGAYINGGIFPLVGGELALAAFEHGFEDYGVDILKRYAGMIYESGASYLWYHRDGRPSSVETSTSPDAMPTDGWGSSAMLAAFVEGLCGVKDEGKLFQKVRLSPRWPAAGVREAEVNVAYGASDAGFRYRWAEDESMIRLKVGTAAEVVVRAMLPSGRTPAAVTVDGGAVSFDTEAVGQSSYVTLPTIHTTEGTLVEIRLAR